MSMLIFKNRKYLGPVVEEFVFCQFAAHLEEFKLAVSYLGVRGGKKTHKRSVYLGTSVVS